MVEVRNTWKDIRSLMANQRESAKREVISHIGEFIRSFSTLGELCVALPSRHDLEQFMRSNGFVDESDEVVGIDSVMAYSDSRDALISASAGLSQFFSRVDVNDDDEFTLLAQDWMNGDPWDPSEVYFRTRRLNACLCDLIEDAEYELNLSDREYNRLDSYVQEICETLDAIDCSERGASLVYQALDDAFKKYSSV